MEDYCDFSPDIITLQEVTAIPQFIADNFSIHKKAAISKNGNPQAFSTAILVKDEIVNELPLQTEVNWVNRELEFFAGNILTCELKIKRVFPLKVTCVYSPPWPINQNRLSNLDVSPVNLSLTKMYGVPTFSVPL